MPGRPGREQVDTLGCHVPYGYRVDRMENAIWQACRLDVNCMVNARLMHHIGLWSALPSGDGLGDNNHYYARLCFKRKKREKKKSFAQYLRLSSGK